MFRDTHASLFAQDSLFSHRMSLILSHCDAETKKKASNENKESTETHPIGEMLYYGICRKHML